MLFGEFRVFAPHGKILRLFFERVFVDGKHDVRAGLFVLCGETRERGDAERGNGVFPAVNFLRQVEK